MADDKKKNQSDIQDQNVESTDMGGEKGGQAISQEDQESEKTDLDYSEG